MIVVFAGEDPVGVAIRIVVLARADRPEKPGQPQPAQKDGNGDQVNEYVHDFPLSRKAFSDTVIELKDMAKAAARGVANPARAIGIAIML